MKVVVLVHDVSFYFDKNPLGELAVSLTVDGVDNGGFIASVRDLQVGSGCQDVRLFDLYGNQNYLNCRYTDKGKSPENRILVVPETDKELRELVESNKEKIVKQFLLNVHNSEPFYATFIGEKTELMSYLSTDDFGYYSESCTPVVLPLKKIIHTHKEENEKLFKKVGQVNLYRFQGDNLPIILTSHEDILKVMELPEFDIRFTN